MFTFPHEVSETSDLPASDTGTVSTYTTITDPGAYEYFGCFLDSEEDRVLEMSTLDLADLTMDVSVGCIQHMRIN